MWGQINLQQKTSSFCVELRRASSRAWGKFHSSVPLWWVAFTSDYTERFPSGRTTTIKINANTPTINCISFTTSQPHLNSEQTTKAESPANRGKAWHPWSKHFSTEWLKQWVEGWLSTGQSKLCTHRSSGNGDWQRSSSATAEGAPEAPRHGASSINPHGALWWSGHDITLCRENTKHREHLCSWTRGSAGWHCFTLAKHLGQRVYLPKEEEEEEAIYRLWVIQKSFQQKK